LCWIKTYYLNLIERIEREIVLDIGILRWELSDIVPPYNSVLRLTYLQSSYSLTLLVGVISGFCHDVGEILLFQSITQCRVVILD